VRTLVVLALIALSACGARTPSTSAPEVVAASTEPVVATSSSDPVPFEIVPAQPVATEEPAPASRDRAGLQRVIRTAVPRVRACYELGLGPSPMLVARVFVSFLIDPDGHVSEAHIRDSQSIPADDVSVVVTQCTLDVVRALVFAPGDAVVGVNYPFVLETVSERCG
jgi:hypothetical protein